MFKHISYLAILFVLGFYSSISQRDSSSCEHGTACKCQACSRVYYNGSQPS